VELGVAVGRQQAQALQMLLEQLRRIRQRETLVLRVDLARSRRRAFHGPRLCHRREPGASQNLAHVTAADCRTVLASCPWPWYSAALAGTPAKSTRASAIFRFFERTEPRSLTLLFSRAFGPKPASTRAHGQDAAGCPCYETPAEDSIELVEVGSFPSFLQFPVA